jgi:hypothetical protein
MTHCSCFLIIVHILKPMECHGIVNKESRGVVEVDSATEALDQGPGAAIPRPWGHRPHLDCGNGTPRNIRNQGSVGILPRHKFCHGTARARSCTGSFHCGYLSSAPIADANQKGPAVTRRAFVLESEHRMLPEGQRNKTNLRAWT